MSHGPHTQESLEFAKNFTVEDTDIFIVTYPKSGTIWMKEIISLVLSEGDLTPILSVQNYDRAPWLEVFKFAQVIAQVPAPRPIATHFPYRLMPDSFHQSKAKVIYVMRNPKDVAVSSFYFHQVAEFLDDPGTFEEFLDLFLEGRVFFGKWTDHIKSWRNTNLGDRIMYVTYEEMKEDLPAALRNISGFVGKDLSDDVIQKISEHCSFEAMKNNPMSNYTSISKKYKAADEDTSLILRKGVTGDWKSHFTPEQMKHFTSTIKKELDGKLSLIHI